MNPLPPSNDDQIWQQMLEYLDGTLSADGVRTLNGQLRQDAALRTVFADLVTREIKLKELGEEAAMLAADALAQAEPVGNVVTLNQFSMPAAHLTESPARSATPPQHWRRVPHAPVRAGLALAASLALIGVALWFLAQPATLARLANLEGGLTIERGTRKFAAQPGDSLRVGDRLVTAPNSRASFKFLGEETEIAVESLTRLQLDRLQGSKRLLLEQGTFEAAVAKQEPGTPLRLSTLQAEAVVVGTRFKLLASAASTRLEVFEGAVNILQSFESPSLLVSAGHGATVVPGQVTFLQKLSDSRGTILLEQWDGSGASTNQTYLSQFMFSGVGAKPGSSRARGYLHPPRSGAYSFHLTGTGDTELWLSDTENPAGARKIWSSTDTTALPAAAQLRTDQRYYVELRCISESEPAAFTLSWTTPGGQQRVVYGDYLSPFDPGAIAR